MNALVSGAELAVLLRPEQPWTRDTIWRWTRDGVIPRDAVIFNGRRARYSVPRLIAAGWIFPASQPV